MQSANLSFRVRRIGANAWEGSITLRPLAVIVQARAHEKKAALTRALATAHALAENPAVQALLPPGTMAALATASKLAQSPAAAEAVHYAKEAGKGLRKLARMVF